MERERLPVAVSYSGGASSEDMVDMLLRKEIPRPALWAVFYAETKEEHTWTDERVAEVEARCKEEGVTFVRASRGSLGDHILDSIATGATRMEQPPFVIDNGDGGGRVQQRCSREFKRRVLRAAKWRWLRRLGMPKRLVSWVGFGADEVHRAVKLTQDVAWESYDFPAIRLGKTRAQQRADVAHRHGDAPLFSMCVFCPWKTPDRWRQTTGRDLDRAIQLDEAARDLEQFGFTDGPAYLTPQLIPVRDLVRRPPSQDKPEPKRPGYDAGACFL